MHEIQTKHKHCKHARDRPPQVLYYVYFSNTDHRYSTVLLVVKVNKSESYVHVPDDLLGFIQLPKVGKYE